MGHWRTRTKQLPEGACALPMPETLVDLVGTAVPLDLVQDPHAMRETLIIGSSVLRSWFDAPWPEPVNGQEHALRAIGAWISNLAVSPGGSVISRSDPFDVLRLAIGYAISDAVIVSARTVALEGHSNSGLDGHEWTAEGMLRAPGPLAPHPELATGLEALRARCMTSGRISRRARPALVICTASGAPGPAERDWLQADALCPEQGRELVILTTESGSRRILRRAAGAPHRDRLRRAIEILPELRPGFLDPSPVPSLLRARHDIRLARHDGGRDLLRGFALAGALHQLDLTFMCDGGIEMDAQLADDSPGNENRDALEREKRAGAQRFFSGAGGGIPADLRMIRSVEAGTGAILASFDLRGVDAF